LVCLRGTHGVTRPSPVTRTLSALTRLGLPWGGLTPGSLRTGHLAPEMMIIAPELWGFGRFSADNTGAKCPSLALRCAGRPRADSWAHPEHRRPADPLRWRRSTAREPGEAGRNPALNPQP
jgi:hypothetical protein